MTRRGAPARTRVPRDPYGIGPVSGYIGPVLGLVALILIGALTLSLFNGQIPFLPTAAANGVAGNGGTDGGPGATPAPSGVIVTVAKSSIPGSIGQPKA